jgi:hypothetical protein
MHLDVNGCVVLKINAHSQKKIAKCSPTIIAEIETVNIVAKKIYIIIIVQKNQNATKN